MLLMFPMLLVPNGLFLKLKYWLHPPVWSLKERLPKVVSLAFLDFLNHFCFEKPKFSLYIFLSFELPGELNQRVNSHVLFHF